MIPPFDEQGLLPDGIHDCTMEEAAERFGTFRSSDRRPRLWARFAEFMRDLKACALMEAVLVDGSFVTASTDLNDIDLVLVLSEDFDFSTDLAPTVYNLLAQHRVLRQFGFDIVVVKNGSENSVHAITFFQQVKQRPGVTKGILRIKL